MGNIENLADLLPVYYRRLFPFQDYYEWLSYGNANYFSRRELSFIRPNGAYVRYQSYQTLQQLQIHIRRLIPLKIDIGAVYNVQPVDYKVVPNFFAVERELTFDIDITDYDDVRVCCKGDDICNKCWKFMILACKILDITLRDDFGFNHILWVYSGRRGIHCWACDPAARALKDVHRYGLTNYLQISGDDECTNKTFRLPKGNIRPFVRRALDIIESEFIPMCLEEQDILGTNEKMEKFLQILPKEEDKKELKTLFNQCPSSKTRWNAFCDFVNNKKTKRGSKFYCHLREEMILKYAHPRLDVSVTRKKNHLLKSPFCVHPKTGKVCVPFTVNTVEEFQPDKVPTIITLFNEIDEFDAKAKKDEASNSNIKEIKDYEKTSLKKSIHIFHEFVCGLKEAQKDQKST